MAGIGLAIAMALVACSGDSDEADDVPSSTTDSVPLTTTAPTTTTTAGDPVTTTGDQVTTTTVLRDSLPSCPDAVDVSPAVFDDRQGAYAALVTEMDAGSTLTFDVIQILFGEAATERYLADNPSETEGPPNDFYIVNENELLRSARLADDATVWLVNLEQDLHADVNLANPQELVEFVGSFEDPWPPYWLTFEAGEIVEVCEQYIP